MPEIRFRQSLRTRMMMFTGIIFLVLAVLIVISILLFVYSTEQDTWRARQNEAAVNAATTVANYLRQNETLMFWLDKYEHDEIHKEPQVLHEILTDNPAYMEIVFIDSTGIPVQGAARGQVTLANQFTILQSEWFQKAKAGQKIYTRVQTSAQNETYTIFAMPARNGEVLAAQIQMDSLWKTVAQIHFGSTGSIYVVNSRGQVIAHPDSSIVLANQNIKDTDLFDAILQAPGKKWTGSAVNFKGINVVSVSAPVEQTDWIVISELPQTEAYATSLRALMVIPLVVILLMVIATFLLRGLLDTLFLRPLELLRTGANLIGQGDLAHRISIPRQDELGEAMSVFNNMTAELEKQQAAQRYQNDELAGAYQQLEIELHERQKAQEALKLLNAELEARVQTRTAELSQANEALTGEIVERQQVEAQLREAETKFRTLVEQIPAAFFIWEPGEDGACHYISPQIEKMLGFSVQEWLTDPQMWKRQLHPDDRERALSDDANTLLTGRAVSVEYRLMTRDGRAVWFRDDASPLPQEPGKPALNFGLLTDITEQKQTEDRIRASLHEKEILLKEIHHRVKNNLQIISSLLNLQVGKVTDVQTIQALRESQARVRSMALIHEKLYQSDSLASIDFGGYVKSLAADLFRSYQRGLDGVQLVIEVDEVGLELDQAVPCGLILNELMTNALKYAYPDGRKGTLRVELRAGPAEMVSLRVVDDGVGLPVDFATTTTKSLGLQLVSSLAAQLEGRLDVDGSSGTAFQVSFKK